MVLLRYTGLRLMLFFGFFTLLLLTRMDLLLAAVFAALFSMVTSYFLQARDREAMARGLEARIERRRAEREEKVAQGRTLEAEEDDEVEGRRR